MTDWKANCSKYLDARDQKIPKEYLVDLAAHGIKACPSREEALPRPADPAQSFKPDWRVAAKIYPADNVTGVPSKVLDKDTVAITETPIDHLLAQLASGKFTSVQVTQAFLKRAILAHQLVNCATEVFVEFALAQAKQRDEWLAKHGKPMGPLHGLPVSLKDQFSIRGIPRTTMGYVAWIDKETNEDSVITRCLLDAGAVIHIRTNIPQSLMRCETDCYVYGRTVSPFNRAFTPGGSSGGEGALVGMRGSPLGVGTDIGGSVRVPSAFNGLYGMRPSMHRIPYAKAKNSFVGQHEVSSVIGPMTHSLEGVTTFMRAVLGQRPWTQDPVLLPLPFNEDAYQLKDLGMKKGSAHSNEVQAYTGGKGQLCFAIEWDDGLVHPHPPITRALKQVKEKLVSAGHKVIDWKPLDHSKAYDIIDRIYAADGGEDIKRSCDAGGEPVMYNLMAEAKQGAARPNISTFDMWQLGNERDQYRQAYLQHWNATQEQTGTGRPVDAVLAPVSNWCACRHDTNDHVSYTTQWNLLDAPVVVLPITHVDPKVDKKEPLSDPYPGRDKEFWDRYDEQLWAGLPVNLGLVGRRLHDEELLGLAKVVCDAGATL